MSSVGDKSAELLELGFSSSHTLAAWLSFTEKGFSP